MITNLLSVVLSLALLPAFAGEKAFKILQSGEVAAALDSKTPPVVLDANGEKTRKKDGVVPGAKLLSSASKYDVAKELPADKKTPLVFYCANTMCTASHVAAERALKAGYTDVSIMEDGIQGWKKRGKPAAEGAGPVKLSPKETAALVEKREAVVVDVREKEERSEVVPGAAWFADSKTGEEKEWSRFVSGLSKDKTVVFHCRAGRRAKAAAEKLSAQGFKTAYFDGPEQWKAAGLPLEKGPATR